MAQQQEGVTEVPPVSVTTPAAPLMDGSAEAGYRVEDTRAAGPFWGDINLQDSPYSATVVPADLIKNTQQSDLYGSLKYVPGVQGAVAGAGNYNGVNSLYIRGFAVGGTQGNNGITYDGLTATGSGFYNTGLVEDKERIEVLEGVNGFLYGVGNSSVAGSINTQLKRPTPIPHFAITTGTNTGHNGYIHGDFGGPINITGLADGILGYRLNIMQQGGGTQWNGQTIVRNLQSGAIDIHLPANLLVQLNASHAYYHRWGNNPVVGLNQTLLNGTYLTPPNPLTRQAIPYARGSNTTDIGGVKVTWKLTDMFTIRSQYAYTYDRLSTQRYALGSITNQSTGAESFILTGSSGGARYTHAGYAFLDADFSIFDIHNKVTMGFNGYYQLYNGGSNSPSSPTNTLSCNFYYETACDMRLGPGGTTPATTYGSYMRSAVYNKNYMIGDEIKALNDKLIVLAGVNWAHTGTISYDPSNGELSSYTGAPTSIYQASAATPAVAITYKIQPWLSAYASFQQSLTTGGVVSQTNSSGLTYTNSGAIIPPYIGTQWEAGLKATVGMNTLMSLSFFDIHKANIYDQDNGNGTVTEMVGGSEIHKGAEFSLAGKLWDDLALFGGLTVMDPRISANPASPYQNGQLAAYASPVTETLYWEYTVPYLPQAEWLRGLTLTGGMTYRSAFRTSVPSSYANIATVGRLPSYTLFDVGFRYATAIDHHPLNFIFTCTNVSNQAYWYTSNQEGPGRTFLATAEFKW